MNRVLPCFLVLLVGCFESRFAGDGGVPFDSSRPDVGGFDVPRLDIGPPIFDGGVVDVGGVDIGPPPVDVGPPPIDAPPPVDSGPRDAGRDIFEIDVGGFDAGPMCDPRDCPPAPGPTCVDDTTLRVFGEPFCDEDFMCDLPIEDFVCERGCEMGRCTEVCGEWTTDIVTGSGNSAGTTSLSVGSRAIFIAYSEGTANELRVANLLSGVWGVETVGRPNVSATPAEIVIDSRDGLHTVYSPPSSTGLRYTFRTSTGPWRTDVLTTRGGRLIGTVVIDDDEVLHYIHRGDGDLGYVRRVAGRFERNDIPNRGYAGPNSMAVMTRGGTTTVMIVVAEAGMFPQPASLGFAERVGNGPWTFDSFGGAATSPALAIDPTGTPFIVDFAGTDLRLRVRRGGVWEQELIDHGGLTGDEPDSVFDRQGNLHISYRDTTSRQLRYAFRSRGGEWRFEVADDTPSTGDDSSIGVGRGGVHISHQSDTSVRERELRYTRFLDCP